MVPSKHPKNAGHTDTHTHSRTHLPKHPVRRSIPFLLASSRSSCPSPCSTLAGSGVQAQACADLLASRPTLRRGRAQGNNATALSESQKKKKKVNSSNKGCSRRSHPFALLRTRGRRGRYSSGAGTRLQGREHAGGQIKSEPWRAWGRGSVIIVLVPEDPAMGRRRMRHTGRDAEGGPAPRAQPRPGDLLHRGPTDALRIPSSDMEKVNAVRVDLCKNATSTYSCTHCYLRKVTLVVLTTCG